MTDTELFDWLEKACKNGACVGLINDDNGHWAVSTSGTQNCPAGWDPEDIDTTFFVFKGEWKNTIRDAIKMFIKENKDTFK